MAALEDAVTHLNRGLRVLSTLSETPERIQQELRLQLALGVAFQLARGYGAPEAGRAHTRTRELSHRVGDTERLFSALGLLFMFHTTQGDQKTAREIGVALLNIAQETQVLMYLMVPHWHLGIQRLFVGKLVEAREHLERAIAYYEPAQHQAFTSRYGLEPGVLSLAARSWVLWLLGYPAQAVTRSQEAMALAETLAYPPGIAMAQSYACGLYVFIRQWPRVQTLAEAVLHVSDEHGLRYWRTAGLVCRGWALAQQGSKEDKEEGTAQIRQGIEASRAMGTDVLGVFQNTLLAEGYGKAGQVKEGLAAIEDVLGNVSAHRTRQSGERFYEPEAHRIKGVLLLMRAEAGNEARGKAEACFWRAIESAREQAAKMLELRATMSLCRLWQQQGKREAARRILQEIYDWFTEGFDTYDLQEARTILKEF